MFCRELCNRCGTRWQRAKNTRNPQGFFVWVSISSPCDAVQLHAESCSLQAGVSRCNCTHSTRPEQTVTKQIWLLCYRRPKASLSDSCRVPIIACTRMCSALFFVMAILRATFHLYNLAPLLLCSHVICLGKGGSIAVTSACNWPMQLPSAQVTVLLADTPFTF